MATDSRIKIVFMGTPEFALPTLKLLAHEADCNLELVVTRPDQPKGRGKKLTPSPVKTLALELGRSVIEPLRLTDPEVLPALQEIAPQVIVVVAFGLKIPAEILNLPDWGCINLHPSLLPAYRGGEPIRRVIWAGETVTGLTTIKLNEAWDAGHIIIQEELPLLSSEETYGSLYDRLAEAGATMLLETLRQLAAGTASFAPQDNTLATKAPILKPDEEIIDWTKPAEEIHRQIRALSPEPGGHTYFREKRIRIIEAEATDFSTPGEPGVIVVAHKKTGLLVNGGDGVALAIKKIQPTGSRVMSEKDFINGYRVQEQETFVSQ